MKLLCLSDLHLAHSDVANLVHYQKLTPLLQRWKDLIESENFDAVAITGDTVVSADIDYIPEVVRALIPKDIAVLLTLGNHEFWGNYFEDTITKLKTVSQKDENIFFLDIVPKVKLGNYNFLGGTLFFDGSLKFRDNQKITPWDGWNDYLIKNIINEYLDIFNYYEEKIAANIDINTSNVLLTHHVPDEKLNAHEANWYGFYSGSKDLIRRLNFPKRYMNYAICGHTHKEVKGQLYDNFCGVNVGSDYGKLSYYILELPNVINKLSL
jgi:predicted phosphodiesterase